MPFDLALVDLFRPYMLRGEATAWHAVLSVIYVESYETATSADGVVIRGVARFSGDVDMPTFDPTTGTLTAGAGNVEGHPRTQPNRTEPWLDITDTRVEFAMTVPRAAGAIIATGVASIPGTNAAFQPVADVLTAWDAIPNDAPPSDYPGTGFVLDLVLSGIEFRPPFLSPAKMEPNGLLVPDTSRQDVVFHLPKVKLRVSQGSDAAAVVDVSLVSLGVSGLDDPGDLSAAELITMQPAYAFIGSGRTVGFAFRSAFLDLADGYTPPDVLDQFGFDSAWTGLYLPEIRIFFAPEGAEDFAVNAGVENLLIGLGNSSGITGDFDLAIISQGDGDMTLSARFFDADRRAIGIRRLTDTTAEVRVPAQTRMVIDVVGGRAPYATTATFDGAPHNGVVHDISVAAGGSETIVLTATDTSTPPKQQTLTITARLREPQAVQPPPGSSPPRRATLETTSITVGSESRETPPLRMLSDTNDEVVVAVDRLPFASNTEWQIDGAPAPTGPTLRVALAGGETKAIRAHIPNPAVTAIDGYFKFDKPPKTGARTYSVTQGNISAYQATDLRPGYPWKPPGTPFLDHSRDVLSRITPATITITGQASHDGDDQKARYNFKLSQRRASGLAALINADAALPTFAVTEEPSGTTPSGAWVSDWQTHHTPREEWWVARISGFSVSAPGPVIIGEARRPATPPPPPVIPEPRDPPPDTPPPPDWFRSARLKVRIVQDQFVALQLSGSIDFETAVEGSLRNQGGTEFPDIQNIGTNAADGIVDYLFLYQTDPASQTDEVKLYIGADPNDRDGLLMTGQLPGQTLQARNTGRNILGMTTIFTPLLAEIAPDNPADGGVAPIALSAAVVALPTALAEIDVDGQPLFNIERVILFGGEGAFRRQGERWEMSFLFDVETAISAKVSLGGFDLLEIPRDTPIAVRYKAIGISFGKPPGSTAPWELRPVFDQSKGYTIDVSGPGAIRLPDPLGQILQVLGARIARTNPLNFEIDLGFAVDLGVISVDRARVRLPLDPVGPPELTAFGAGLKVPGVIEGKGYMEMNNSGGTMEIAGGIDVSLIPIKLRVAAQIRVAEIDPSEGGPATAVAIALEVELPVAIPLAQSGFGIYGFLGMFAMHYTRDEDGITSLTPALTWLKDRAQGNPTNLQAWKPKVGSWAFGVGITLGTMGSPIIFNVKGMFLLELPGPRILLVVKAKLLAALPALKDKNAEGTFLCVIDLDFGRGTLTIGISIDFTIKPLVEIKIPIEAYFNLEGGGDWHVYLGTFPGSDTLGRPMPGPIRINILDVFNGAGYVMISGHGIPEYDPPASNLPSLPSVSGTALAVGLEVTLLWGNTSINLYLRVTAGFNAILGFDPFYIGGLLYLRGELKLFIISLSASAGIAVQIGQRVDGPPGAEVRTQISRLDGEVCGELDLFFFTIKGCVDFHIGEANQIVPPPPRLVTATSLVSRTPALALGTGTDRGIDSKIGDAIAADTAPAHDTATEDDPDTTNTMPVVPIDAIPVLTMSATPRDDTLTIFGAAPGGSPGAPDDGFVKRGDYSYRYDLTSVLLETSDGSPALSGGNAPSVWWTLKGPADDNLTAQLALLNWTPNPTPKALERTEHMEETVIERWGTICNDAAPAAPVLWTFAGEPLGPSEPGWHLTGIAWPDPPDTQRSAAPDLGLHIHETWRTGDRALDRRRGLIPAIIEGGKVPCLPENLPQPGDETPPPLTHGSLTPPADNPFIGNLLGTLNDLRPDTGRTDTPTLRPDLPPIRRPLTRPDLRPLGRPTLRPALQPSGLAVTTATASPDRIGGLASAARPTRPAGRRLAAETERLVAATAGSTGRRLAETLDAPALRLDEAVRRLTVGEAINRSSILATQPNGMMAATNDGPVTTHVPDHWGDLPLCDGRVLASPLWDIGAPVVFGNRARADATQNELDLLGHVHGPLSDVLRIESGELTEGSILMWVNRRLLNKQTGRGRGLVIHYLDKDNNILDTRPIRVSDLLTVTNLPSRWLDPDGPWLEDVFHAVLYGQLRLKTRVAVWVKLEPPAGMARMDVGVLYQSPEAAESSEQQGRPYYIGAIEFTTLGEQSRSDWDQSQITRDRSVVETFLGPASADVALMQPDTTYRVTTVTDVSARDGNGDPAVIAGDTTQTEIFWFRTDDNAPRRLDPWLLCALPGPEETHVFGHEQIKIVFATNDVDQLYAAYGKRLEVRLKASSFRQVDDPGVQHPYEINASTLTNINASVLSPFEAVLADVLREVGPCIPVDENRVRHSELEIPIPLDPYTDYVLDIEAVDDTAAPGTAGERVLRRAFSTGSFLTMADFADDFASTLTEHRAVAPGVMQAIGTTFAGDAPEGAEFDQALIDAGLEPMPVPEAPRIVVFWEQANHAATPQPAAILLDASEPMQRTRLLPTEITTTDPVPITRTEMRHQEWMTIGEAASGDNIVRDVVFAPGSQRALITLDAGARGKILHLDLIRRAFTAPYLDGPTATDTAIRIVSETLRHAPWEET